VRRGPKKNNRGSSPASVGTFILIWLFVKAASVGASFIYRCDSFSLVWHFGDLQRRPLLRRCGRACGTQAARQYSSNPFLRIHAWAQGSLSESATSPHTACSAFGFVFEQRRPLRSDAGPLAKNRAAGQRSRVRFSRVMADHVAAGRFARRGHRRRGADAGPVDRARAQSRTVRPRNRAWLSLKHVGAQRRAGLLANSPSAWRVRSWLPACSRFRLREQVAIVVNQDGAEGMVP